MTSADWLHLGTFLLGVFVLCFGLAFWIAGFANPRTSVWRQNAYASLCIVAAIYLLAFAFTGSLPY